MKKLIVGRDVKYARSAVDTASTAVTPDMLFPGSVGIYGIDPATSKSVLINAANDDDPFTEYIVAVGTAAGGPVVSQPMVIATTSTGFPKGSAVAADVTHKVAVGYNGTAGSFNWPTFADRDSAEIKLIRDTHGINQRVDKDSFEASNIRSTDSDYEVVLSLLAAVTNRDENVRFVNDNVLVLNNGSGSVFGNTATCTVTNGSTVAVLGATHGVTTGTWISLYGSLYQAALIATNDMTLDRPYTGATEVIANTETLDLGDTIPTELGLQFEGQDPTLTFSSASGETAEDATHTTNAGGLVGVGSALYMTEQVRLHGASMGYYDQIDRRRPAPDFNVIAGGTYDVYYLETQPVFASKDEMDGSFSTKYQVQVAFVAGGGADNQTVFQTVINTIHGTSLSV
jgi:hypothetical protein